MYNLVSAFLEVVENFAFIAMYGIPILQLLNLVEYPFWSWMCILILHTIVKSTRTVVESYYNQRTLEEENK